MTNNCGDSVRQAYPLFQEEGGGCRPTSPLQFNIGEIGAIKACQLNSIWHSRLPRIEVGNVVRNPYYICFAAEYGGEYYAVGIWSSPVALNRFNCKNILELRRFAICPDAPKNTASRMLRIMIHKIRRKFPQIEQLISYQDSEVHKGTIYKASGWIIKGISKYREWDSQKRKRNDSQSTADKVVWIKEV